jgi:hypothetical protein
LGPHICERIHKQQEKWAFDAVLEHAETTLEKGDYGEEIENTIPILGQVIVRFAFFASQFHAIE